MDGPMDGPGTNGHTSCRFAGVALDICIYFIYIFFNTFNFRKRKICIIGYVMY